ncbi:flagellar hook-length control protein FliK [Methylobacterium oxalidis]|uniref:Flagellar hook-length control protein-like C-terminal domain-containing protein n=1 Tax=Methylobacterium oxalidis TaxID=944322 RepID=A0A512J4X8_9HYPH|nr:flagellar hook-length control protein FliK [Methylobacterium oxalidis]GEP05037.1 hypothetical protein MOX02_30750 [Methylobacterium oxalidis]GJE33365.1 hypothetical protein LDDCCGHA_3565 [Methylobacterium oxalidis]GLS65684.1 hypothetical protein GCM10007888_40660 [Methylobacterium oxalidis]
MGFSAADLMDVVARRPAQSAAQDARPSRPVAAARERFNLDVAERERPAPRAASVPERRDSGRTGDAVGAARKGQDAAAPRPASADRARGPATIARTRGEPASEPTSRAPADTSRDVSAAAPRTDANPSVAAEADQAATVLAEAAEAQHVAEGGAPEEDEETPEADGADEGQPAGGLFALLAILQPSPAAPPRFAAGAAMSKAPAGETLEAPPAEAGAPASGHPQTVPGAKPEPGSAATEAAGVKDPRRAGDGADPVPAGTETQGEPGKLDFAGQLATATPQAPPADPQSFVKEGPAVPGLQAQSAQGAERSAAQAHSPPVPIGQVPMTIGLRSLSGSNQFEIRLDPVELGRVDVRLEIDKERGTVTTHLVVERVETLALLQRDANGLQQALAQAGLDPSEGGINLSLRGDGQPGSGAEQREGQRRGAPLLAETPELRGLDAAPLRSLRGLTGLDIRI